MTVDLGDGGGDGAAGENDSLLGTEVVAGGIEADRFTGDSDAKDTSPRRSTAAAAADVLIGRAAGTCSTRQG